MRNTYLTKFNIYDKNSQQNGIEGMYFNIMKVIYNEPTATIILSNEKPKAFSLRSAMRWGCPLSLFLFNIVLGVPASTGQLGKKKIGIQT